MYKLAIGDRTYSSWSLRGWLLFAKFNIPVSVQTARMYTDAFPDMLKSYQPARTVPALQVEGLDTAVWDSLSIAELLHERHPDAGIWPNDPADRAIARSLASEMHSGFASLRDECTMNLEFAYSDFPVSEKVMADLERLEQLWALALGRSEGPWLFGSYSAADVFFAPVATRIATYGLPVSERAMDYTNAHLNDLAFRQWRAMGLAQNYVQQVYQLPFSKSDWPGPKPLAARPVTNGVPENATCPYSGEPVREDSLAEIDGRTVGFCNPFCRDKSVADAQAWPKLMQLLQG